MSPPPPPLDGSGASAPPATRRGRRDRTSTPVPDQDLNKDAAAKQAKDKSGKENTQDADDHQLIAARLNRLRSAGGGAASPVAAPTHKRPTVQVPPPPPLVVSQSHSQPKTRSTPSSDNDDDDNEQDRGDDDSLTPNQSLSASTDPNVSITDLIANLHANVDSTSAAALKTLSDTVAKIPTTTTPALLPANHPRRTPLHSAIMRKNPKALQSLLANGAICNAWINMADHAGSTPLVLCLRSKKTFNLDIVRSLLASGASAFGPPQPFVAGDAGGKSSKKAADDPGFTPLDVLAWAMQHISADTDADVFDRIVADARKHGVLDQVTNEGYGALHLAVNLGTPMHVRSLLDVGAMDPASTRNRKWPVVHFAACNNQISMLHLLLDAGCPVNLPAHDGQTPLHAAAAAGHVPVIDYLLSQGADATLRDANGWMPVTWSLDALCKRAGAGGAAAAGSRPQSDDDGEQVDGDDVLDVFETHWTHLHARLAAGDPEVALAKVVANKTKQGETLVDLALVHGNVEVAVWLMVAQGVRSARLAGVGDVDVLGLAMNMLADQVAGAKAEVRRIKEETHKQGADETHCIVIDSDGEEEVPQGSVMATPNAKGKEAKKHDSSLMSIDLSPIHAPPPPSTATPKPRGNDADGDRMDVDATPEKLPPVPRLRPILPAAPGRYPKPAIRVAMPEDAARVLVAALDSHLGDVAGLYYDDPTTALGPLDPEAYLAGDHSCVNQVNRIQDMVHELALKAGVASGLDAVNPALDRAVYVAQAHPMVDLEPALAVMQVALGKHVTPVAQGTKVIHDMQAADSDVRAAANEAAKDLTEFTRLQEARDYLGALRAEDRWMGKQLAMLARRGELLRRVERAASKQASVVEGITLGAQWADKELDKMALAVEEKTRVVELRVKELAGVRERVRMAVGALEVEWQAKIAGRPALVGDAQRPGDNSGDDGDDNDDVMLVPPQTQQPTVPWLLEFCSLFLHMERMLARESGQDATGSKASKESGVTTVSDDDRHPPVQVLSRMLQWYLEAKSGEAQTQHKAMSTCLRALQAHAETLTLVRRATEWATGAMLAHVRSGLNTLQGHAGNLKQAIPATYEELHGRLVFNERLCKRNCKDMQMDLREVLETKNKAFEARRMGDLQRCDDQVRHLHEALEKEEKRLVAIEDLMQRAFAAAHRYLDQERVEQLQQEYLELGVLLKFNVPPTSTVTGGVRTSKKRPRPGAESPAPSTASNTTGAGAAPPSTAGSSTVRGTLASSLSMLMGGPRKYEVEEDDDGEDTRSEDGFGSFLMSQPPHKVRRVSGSGTPRQALSRTSTAFGYARGKQEQQNHEHAVVQQPGVLRRALTAPVGVVKSIFSFSWLPTWSSSNPAAQQPLEAGGGRTDDDAISAVEYRSRLRALTQTHYRRNTIRPNPTSTTSADTSTVSSMAADATTDDTTLNSEFLELGDQSVVSGTTTGDQQPKQYHRHLGQGHGDGAEDLSVLGDDDSF